MKHVIITVVVLTFFLALIYTVNKRRIDKYVNDFFYLNHSNKNLVENFAVYNSGSERVEIVNLTNFGIVGPGNPFSSPKQISRANFSNSGIKLPDKTIIEWKVVHADMKSEDVKEVHSQELILKDLEFKPNTKMGLYFEYTKEKKWIVKLLTMDEWDDL